MLLKENKENHKAKRKKNIVMVSICVNLNLFELIKLIEKKVYAFPASLNFCYCFAFVLKQKMFIDYIIFNTVIFFDVVSLYY